LPSFPRLFRLRHQSQLGTRVPVAGRGVEKGREAFLALKCNTCHKVEGMAELPPPTKFNLTLGGETPRVKTYAELVTAVINPSHVGSLKYAALLKDAKETPMPKFNHEMTVEQMIDIVTFLQWSYKLVLPDYQQRYPL